MSQAIEIVIFRPKRGVSPEQLRTAALSVTATIAALPGYLSREFGESADGQYVDVVHWESVAAANNAMEAVMASPKCGEFFALIDETSMQLMHFNKVA